MKTHKDLNVWMESIAFVTLIYEKTKSFPKDELFALANVEMLKKLNFSTLQRFNPYTKC